MTNSGEQADKRYLAETGLLLRCMIAMAAADGMLLGKELDMIAKIHADLTGASVDRGKVAERFLQWQNDGNPSIEEIVGPGLDQVGEHAKAEIFKAACRIMLSDGGVAESERQRLAEIALALGLGMPTVVDTLLAPRE